MGLNILLLSILPAILYILVIYVTIPYKKINLRTSFAYLFIGFMSVGFLKYFLMAFPEWYNIAENLTGSNYQLDYLIYYHYLYFIQVSFIEELSKLIIFLLIEYYRYKTEKIKDHPLATMFYMVMVSLGFAVIENIHYGTMYGDRILYLRTFTAVIGHIVFGLFMGYWIAMGRIGPRFYNRSLFDIVVNNRKVLRNVIYGIIGIMAATILHGIYDLHLELNDGGTGITGIYILLIFSLLGGYWCFRNITKLYNEKEQKLRG